MDRGTIACVWILVTLAAATSDAESNLGSMVSSVSDDRQKFSYVQACTLISTQPAYFKQFRRIPGYIEVVEPTDAWVAEAYLTYLVRNQSWMVQNESAFRQMTQMDLYGDPYLHQFVIDGGPPFQASALALRFAAFIGKVSQHVFTHRGDEAISTVLEIGGGFGGFAVAATRIFGFRSYTIVDLAEALAVQGKFVARFPSVASKINYIDGKSLTREPENEQTYDLCVSTYAFSELALPFRQLYFDRYISKCKFGFFTDNGNCFDQYRTAQLHFGAPALAERLNRMGRVETQVVDEVPSTTGGLSCRTFELYFWPKSSSKRNTQR